MFVYYRESDKKIMGASDGPTPVMDLPYIETEDVINNLAVFELGEDAGQLKPKLKYGSMQDYKNARAIKSTDKPKK